MEPGKGKYPFRNWREDVKDETIYGDNRTRGLSAENEVSRSISIVQYTLALVGWVIAFSIILPVLVGLVAFLIQCFLFFKNGFWHKFSIIDLLSVKDLEFSWAARPDSMLGLHRIFSSIDLWMLLPTGLLWAITILLSARLCGFFLRNYR